jgi:hypothetical protein
LHGNLINISQDQVNLIHHLSVNPLTPGARRGTVGKGVQETKILNEQGFDATAPGAHGLLLNNFGKEWTSVNIFFSARRRSINIVRGVGGAAARQVRKTDGGR